MKITFKHVWVCIFLVLLVGLNSFSQVYFNFSEKEKKWLKTHPVIKVAPDPDFPPIEYFDKTGKYLGVSSSFVKIIEEMLGIKFEIVKLKNWGEAVNKFNNKEIDMLSALVSTKKRRKKMKFTLPYISIPSVVIVRKGTKIPHNLEQLGKMKMALVKENVVYEFFNDNIPNLDYLEVKDLNEGLEYVSNGKVDVMVANVLTATYYIEKNMINNLYVERDVGFVYSLRFAVRDDYPLLISSVNKIIKKISADKNVHGLMHYNKYETSKGIHISRLNFVLILLGFMILIFLSIFFHIKKLKKALVEKSEELENSFEKERVLSEEIQKSKKMEGIGFVAGSVAHDLNNILSGVLTYPDLLLYKMEKDNPFRRQVKVIKESAEKAAAIVSDLLTMTRSSSSERKVINTKNMIRDYINSPECKELKTRYPNVKISSQFPEDVDNIVGSKVHIEKLLGNLIMNGMEAVERDNENGVVKISAENIFVNTVLKGFEQCDTGNYVKIAIKDNGVGISKKEIEKIFKPFYSTKEMGKSGTGLGLTIVWNTMISNKGMIFVESDGESYTEFILYFPATKFDEEKYSKFTKLDTIMGKNQLILVVDDEFLQIEVLSDILESLNYRVETARNGEEAIRKLKTTKIDLVVLDMLMPPGINGRITYEKMLKINPHQKAIISTGISESEDIDKALKLGVNSIISKPYTIEKIGKAVKNALTSKNINQNLNK